MEIDRAAPVAAERDVEIRGEQESVWNVLIEVERWPSWQPDISSAKLDGNFAEGTQFRWKAGPSIINSTVERVDRPRLVGWRGKTFGAQAVHVWKLESTPTGTRVTTEESMSGLIPRLLRGWMQRSLEKSLDTWLRELTKTVEARNARDGR